MTSHQEPGGDFGRDSWERRWSDVLRKGAHAVDQHPPNAHLLAVVADLHPGRALDAGAGHGAETLWLAEQGWRVTAVDFSTTALEHARRRVAGLGADIAARVEWVAADLGAWTPPPAYDLVACLYVHVAGSVREMVQRLAAGVAPGGTLLLVGHGPPARRPAGRRARPGRCRSPSTARTGARARRGRSSPPGTGHARTPRRRRRRGARAAAHLIRAFRYRR